jgi:hypothetical protein
MLFITVRSASPADVQRVLQVVEHVKRLRHKRGKISEVTVGHPSEELHQYVIYDSQPAASQRIKLDGPASNAYRPPSSLTVHLSKIPIPELRPRPIPQKDRQSSGSLSKKASMPRFPPIPAPPPGRHPPSSPPLPQPTAAKTGSFWGRPRK